MVKTTKTAATKTGARKKVVKKKAVKKVIKKKVKKGGPKPSPKVGTTERGPSVRVRALTALKKGDMTAPQVKEAISLSHSLKPTLDQEVERGHLKHTADPGTGEGTATVFYHLTAKGAKALENGTVDPPRKTK